MSAKEGLYERFMEEHKEEDLVKAYLDERNLRLDYLEWKAREFEAWIKRNGLA